MDSGWSLKHLHRLIVTSATYRQSSRVTPELLATDPYNRLLARGPRFRVDAEVVRDIALAASGLLESARSAARASIPPAPGFLFQPPASYGPKIWAEATGPDRYRRALYTFRYRSVPYPMLQTFDAPNGDFSCVRRARSNTPLQALTTAQRAGLPGMRPGAGPGDAEGRAAPTDADRLTYAFRRCLAREPAADETGPLSGPARSARPKRFASGAVNPWDLAVDKPEEAAPAARRPRRPPSSPAGPSSPASC